MKLYTHPAFKDVFFDLLHIIHIKDKVKVKVEWWNKSQTGNPFRLHIITKHTLSKDKWEEFIKYQPDITDKGFRELY